MKRFGIVFFLVICLISAACGGGSSNSSDTLTGNWTANLTNTDGTLAFTFTTSFTQSNGSTITGTNLTFTVSSGCFTSAATQTGSFVLSGNFNGNISGSFQLTITSATPSDNTLTLQGTVNNNAITGGWTLAGLTPGCTGEGDFTFTRIS
jgi:hypothetical protein